MSTARGFQSVEDELSELGPEETGEQPAAPDSALGSLRQRRAAVQENLYFDLEVPGWGTPPIYVRYKWVPQRQVEASLKRTSKMRTDDRTVLTNALVLAEACIGIFEVIDGREVSIDPDDRDGEWLKFDDRLGELLRKDGEPKPKKATDVVRMLYFMDGDIISTAGELGAKSGYAQEQYERESGN